MSIIIISLLVILCILYLVNKKIPVFILLISLPLFPFYWNPIFIIPFNNLNVQQTISIGILAGMVIETSTNFLNRRIKFQKSVFEIAILIFCFLLSLSGFSLYSFSAAVRGFLLNLINYYVPFALIIRFADSEKNVQSLLDWILWPSILIGAITIVEYFQQEPLIWDFFNKLYLSSSSGVWMPATRNDIYRVQATFGQSIFLAFYLVTTSMIAFLSSTKSSGIKRPVLIATSAFLFLCSYLPMARGAIIAGIVALLLFFLFSHAKIRSIIPIVFFGIFVLLLFYSTLFSNISGFWTDFVTSITRSSSGHIQVVQMSTYEYRRQILDLGTKLIISGPLLGYADYTLGGNLPFEDVANVFLQVGLVGGWVTLTYFLGVISSLILLSIKNLASASSDDQRYITLVSAILVILIIFSWVDSSWPGQYTQFGWMSLGLIVAVSQIINHAQRRTSRTSITA